MNSECYFKGYYRWFKHLLKSDCLSKSLNSSIRILFFHFQFCFFNFFRQIMKRAD